VLTFEASNPKILLLANATAAKASLISHKAMSSILSPAFSKAFGMACEGAIGKSIGAQAASAKADVEEQKRIR